MKSDRVVMDRVRAAMGCVPRGTFRVNPKRLREARANVPKGEFHAA